MLELQRTNHIVEYKQRELLERLHRWRAAPRHIGIHRNRGVVNANFGKDPSGWMGVGSSEVAGWRWVF